MTYDQIIQIPIPAVTASSEASTSTPRKSITIHPQGTSSRYPESFQVWENATIRNILNVTLDVSLFLERLVALIVHYHSLQSF
jgi:hypothetical protein